MSMRTTMAITSFAGHIALIFAVLAGSAMSLQAGYKTKPVAFNALVDWQKDNQGQALDAFVRSCNRLVKSAGKTRIADIGGTPEDWKPACEAALALGVNVRAKRARAFFERHFFAVEIVPERKTDGFFTGYFEPVLAGSRTRNETYTVPIYKKPDDLIRYDNDPDTGQPLAAPIFGRKWGGRFMPFYSRREIETGALDGRGLEFVYVKDATDAFFMHIQGSARIKLTDGTTIRAVFDAKNGFPYTSIGRILIDTGAIGRADISMQTIRAWLKANPKIGREVLWRNKSYIFFRETGIENRKLGPRGAAGVVLTPGRSLAVDKTFHVLGTPMWIQTAKPSKPGRTVPLHALMIAQDTGSAIVGPARGDIFFGTGNRAGEIAGKMKHQGRLFVLLPRSLARKFQNGTGH